MKTYFIYILCSQKNGTLYVGVTSNLQRRIHEHKSQLIMNAFTSKHNVTRLIYVEQYATFEPAVIRESRIKQWPRQWKIDLINKNNPTWDDISLL